MNDPLYSLLNHDVLMSPYSIGINRKDNAYQIHSIFRSRFH